MPITKRYKQSNGTVVEALFTDDGKQVLINDGNRRIWAPVTQEMLDTAQDTAAEKQAKLAEHADRKRQEAREIEHAKSDLAGIIVDTRNRIVTKEELPHDTTEEPVWLVEDPRRRRR